MPTPRAVSTVMLKGGTTKSTITANTAEALGRAGYDTLAVDTDPNGHLSMNLGYGEHYHNADADLGDVILSQGDATPADVIHDTDLGFDLLPATESLEAVKSGLDDELQPSLCLKQELVEPLLGDSYDYILVDTDSSRDVLVNNAVVAAPEVILPLVPQQGIMNGLTRTRERIIEPLRDRIGLEVLAAVPNKLRQRIDHQTSDRELVESLCRSDHLSKRVPEFAWVSPADFDAIDAGEDVDIPKPGIRFDQDIDDAFSQDMTLGAYNPENQQLNYFDELGEIVANGGSTDDGRN